jgi:hypothetical protein
MLSMEDDRPCRLSPRRPLHGQQLGIRFLRRKVARARSVRDQARTLSACCTKRPTTGATW